MNIYLKGESIMRSEKEEVVGTVLKLDIEKAITILRSTLVSLDIDADIKYYIDRHLVAVKDNAFKRINDKIYKKE